MLTKLATVLLVVGATLATPTTASADDSDSFWAWYYLNWAYNYAYNGDWYNAYVYAEYGGTYAGLDYEASGDEDAWRAWHYGYQGYYFAYEAYLYGDPVDEGFALDYLNWAYFWAAARYAGG
jgi:hypothetical protein